jgi:hypothetical protein
MNTNPIRQAEKPVNVICAHCARTPDFFDIEEDSVLLRYRIHARCHGQEEIKSVSMSGLVLARHYGSMVLVFSQEIE